MFMHWDPFHSVLFELYYTQKFQYTVQQNPCQFFPTKNVIWKTLYTFWYIWRIMDLYISETLYLFMRNDSTVILIQIQPWNHKLQQKMFNMKLKKTFLSVYSTIKQMMPITPSFCVEMCMNSGKRYVLGRIHLVIMELTFQHIQMWITGCHWKCGCVNIL